MSRKIAKLYSEMIFFQGYVHCDPHPGNVLVRKGSRGQVEVVLLDHGLYTVSISSTDLRVRGAAELERPFSLRSLSPLHPPYHSSFQTLFFLLFSSSFSSFSSSSLLLSISSPPASTSLMTLD